LSHGLVEAYVLEDLDPGDENCYSSSVLESLIPECQIGKVGIKAWLGKQALEHDRHDDVSINAETDRRQ
jgi:hypothetical protein